MIINKRQFVIFWTTAHTHEYEAMKKQIVKLQLNEKKSNEKPDNFDELTLKTKAGLKEGPDNIQQSSLDFVFFSLIGYHLRREVGGGGEAWALIETGRPCSREWSNFGDRWTRWVGDLVNWIIFMDIIYISFLS